MVHWPDRPTCHDNDFQAQRLTASLDREHVAEWQKRDGVRKCSYCGSIHPEDLKNHIMSGGAVGGSDWKYGWPHKFYLDAPMGRVAGKWYNTHLQELDEETFNKIASLIGAVTGISFSKDEEGRLMYSAPYGGYQVMSNSLAEEELELYRSLENEE